MHKQDYEKIASLVRRQKKVYVPSCKTIDMHLLIIDTLMEFCKILKKDNLRFDKEKFIKACGYRRTGHGTIISD